MTLRNLELFILGCGFILLGILLFFATVYGRPGRGHGKPTPSPSPTPSATPIPQVTLAWDPSPQSADPAAGYYLKYGFVPGGENAQVDTGMATTWTLQVQSGDTYYFVVIAYDSARNQGPPSNEVSYAVPP